MRHKANFSNLSAVENIPGMLFNNIQKIFSLHVLFEAIRGIQESKNYRYNNSIAQ